MTTIGQRIKKRRLELGLSQEELAKRMGNKSRASVCTVEKDKEDLTTDRIRKYAEALETTPTYLMGWEDENGELTLLGRVGTSYINGDFLSTVTEDEIEILTRLRSIPEKDKTRVLDLWESYYLEYMDDKKESSLA